MILTILPSGGAQVTVTHGELATLALELDGAIRSEDLLAILVEIAIATNNKLGGCGSRGKGKGDKGGDACLHVDGW